MRKSSVSEIDTLEPEIEPSEHTKQGPLVDAKAVKADREKAELRKLQEASDLKAVMGTPAGRRLMARVLELTGVHLTEFVDSPRATAYNLGAAKVGHNLIAMMRRECIQLMRLMEDEETP